MNGLRRLLQSLFGSLASVRGQLTLVLIVTTGVALLTMTGALLHRALTDYRQSLFNDLDTEAGIVALLTTPALAFDDQMAAARNLAALSAKPDVEVAALYGAGGGLYASYLRPGFAAAPLRLPQRSPGVRLDGDRLVVTREVVRNGEYLGEVYLGSTYAPWAHVRGYVGVLVTIMLLSLGVALVLAARLRRRITGPVEALATVADQIVTRRDPTLRAPQTSLQEFAVVVRAFNKVLDEAEERTREVQRGAAVYRAIGESIDYGVWICNAEGRNIYSSDSLLRLLGITQAECSDLGWSQALHPDDVDTTLEAWQECVRTGGFWYREHRYRGADGRYHPILAQGVPIHDDAGAISGWAGINLDIARLKKTEDALRSANRRKDDFLATLAHELRNPLAPIRHATRLLGMTDLDSSQAQVARDIIARQVSRMALLLDDLLEVSRITRGRLELRKQSVMLSTLVTTAVETSRPLLESKRHQFTMELPDRPVELEVDPLRISQALSNVLNNAAKYTDAGGHIHLRVRCVAGHTEFSVRDSGIGLPAEKLSSIFEMFSQVDSAIDRSEGGLGIGLSLVKGLVELHGGSVEAASDGEGRGSTFTIRVPGGREVTEPAEPPQAAAPAAPPATGHVEGAGHILLIDDNVDATTTLAMLLRRRGHIVVTANSGEEGLQMGNQLQPRVVILDIGMPGMNGYEVAWAMRQTGWGRRALLLALTGWGHREDIRRARTAGFDAHLTKPADADRIQALLKKFLDSGSRDLVAL